MSFFTIILTILGLSLFETVSSVDNAVINAEVLSTMGPKGRRWFTVWGMLFAVFAIRGLLPWLIVWLTAPQLGPIGALTASFTSNIVAQTAIKETAPLLLMSGGVFLIFLFLHWLFLESKNFGLAGERFFIKHGVWFYGIVSIILTFLVWQGIQLNPYLAFAAVIGSTTFFIIHGFKESAAQKEQALINKGISDISKIFYLEIIDATFSIDGVLGAFAFTFSVPLIWIGNSLGAIVVRQLTVSNIDKIKKYAYLKNGAMYSILILGLIMTLDGFGYDLPQWISPAATFVIVGYFFWKSKKSKVYAQ